MRLSQLATLGVLAAALIGMSGCNNIMPQKNAVSGAVTNQVKGNLNLLQVAQSNPDFSLLVEAVQAAGLTGVLANPNANFTIFAPTNDAFVKALQETGMTKAQLFGNKAALSKILGYHVINGNKALFAKDVKPGNIVMLSGDTLMVTPIGQLMDEMGRTTTLLQTDVAASNGVIHVIDRVLLPR